LKLVVKSLDDDKAEDIVTVALAGKSTIADYMVIASGRSTRQVSAIAQRLTERIKAATGARLGIEGLRAGDWVLVDAGDVVVHVFRPEVRSFYNLEKLWAVTMPESAVAVG
jgi:ribosome-associated protein